MREFLESILPATGVYYAVVIKDNKTYHIPTETIDDLVLHIQQQDNQGHQVYYACSSFREKSYEEWSEKFQRTIKRYRTRKNVRAAKSFWIDLDVEAGHPEKYNDRQEAVADIKRLVSLGMLEPVIVSSGYGIHCYWPLTNEEHPDRWTKIADIFKQTLGVIGIKQDPSRTSDIVSVLRPVGTFNRKNGNAAPVKQITKRGPYTTEQFFKAVKTIAAPFKDKITVALKPAAQASAAKGIVDLGKLYDSRPVALEEVKKHCAQMAHVWDKRGDVSEPLWYAAIGVIAFSEDAERNAVEWSCGHKAFNANDTIYKMRQWKDACTGPATCAKFQAADPGLSRCSGCKLAGKKGFVTPAQIGQSVVNEPAIPVVHTVEPEVVIQVPESTPDVAHIVTVTHDVSIPKGYVRNAEGLHVVTDDVAGLSICFFPHDLYIEDIIVHDGHEEAVVTYQKPMVGLRKFRVKTSAFNKLDTFWAAMSDNGVYIEHKGNAEIMMQYGRAFLSSLQQERQSLTASESMGWREDGSFLLGGYEITKDGVLQNLAAAREFESVVPIQMKGDINTWIGLTDVFKQNDLYAHAFGFLVGMSAPLYKFSGFGGVTVNLLGLTGLGKTTVQRLVNSMYGDPEKLLFKERDSTKSIMYRIGVMANLPVCVDEMGNAHKNKVSDLILAMTQGMDSATLTQGRELRERKEWSTVSIWSSNHSMINKLTTMKADSTAEAMRLIELSIRPSRLFSDSDKAKALNRAIMANTGHAGMYFISKIVEMGQAGVEKLMAQCEKWMKSKGIIFAAQERFWENAFILALTAGTIASRLGLIRFDPRPVLMLTYEKQLMAMRQTVKESMVDAMDLLAGFVNENFDKMIVVIQQGKDIRCEYAPKSGRVVGRVAYFVESGKIIGGEMSLCIGSLKAYFDKKFVDYASWRNEVVGEECIVATNRRVLFGRGTIFRTPQTPAIVFNLGAHERLIPMLERTALASVPNAPVGIVSLGDH